MRTSTSPSPSWPRNKLPPYLLLGEEMGLGKVDYKDMNPVEVVSG